MNLIDIHNFLDKHEWEDDALLEELSTLSKDRGVHEIRRLLSENRIKEAWLVLMYFS